MAKRKFATGLRRLASRVALAVRRALGGGRRSARSGMSEAERQVMDVAEVMGSGRKRRPIPVNGEQPMPSERDIRQAIELLERSGWGVSEWGELVPPQPDGTTPVAPSIPTVPSVPGVPDAGAPNRARGRQSKEPEDWGPELNLDTRLRLPSDTYDPRHKGPVWTLTPQSSNVYAFAYDYDHGLLYVVFKQAGERGQKVNQPGAMYSYGSAARPIPVRLYQKLLTTSSKGKFVWDHLRIRGTIWGHQYVYSFVSPGPSGYVARKATRRGLRVRTVPVVRMVGGRKRTTLVRSQRPERLN